MDNFCVKTGIECYKSSDLSLLYQISRRLSESRNIKDALYPVVKMMAEYIGMNRVIITILNRENNKIFTEAAYGLSEAEKARGKYNIGEGIIGRVVETGQSVIIPRINDEPMFLNKMRKSRKTEDNKDISFVCAPIKLEEKIVGTISINRIYYEDISLENDLQLLTIIASMIAESVRARQDKVEELERLRKENLELHEELNIKKRPFNIVGTSGKMRQVYELIGMVSRTNSTVLVRGESGVGKELIAEAIHTSSNRAEKPIVKVNCAALPDSLIESELFGHEKGAFTGADTQRKGRFELAQGGTIFLDEIGDLPAQTQVKLLRVLQEKEFERLGGSQTIKSDVRIITATNRDLEKMVKEGKFREDLYYRLNVFPIYVPALRERLNDIPVLADHFIAKFNRENCLEIKRITASAIDLLMVYHWPGNVRELENCIERASIMSQDSVIRAQNLPPSLQTAESSGTYKSGSDLNTIVENVEKQLILDTLILTRGNVHKASEKLKVTERILGLRIKKYNIEPKRYKRKKGEKDEYED